MTPAPTGSHSQVPREPVTAVIDGWYAMLPGAADLRTALLRTPLTRRLPAPLVEGLMRMSLTRGLLLFAASLVHPVVGVTREFPGSGTLLLLRALFGRRRKLVVFQYIVHPRRHPLRRLLHAIDGWATRRALRRGHALSRADQSALARRYDMPEDRFAYVPWPLAKYPPDELPPEPSEPLVLSAGRAHCDWPTLFAAAEGQEWPLVVVCQRRDRRAVDRLNAGGRAVVHSELPRDEFVALLRRATISVACMREGHTSQGHIRVMDGMTHGVAIVATATESLRGYVREGETGVLVPAGDVARLRKAVGRLLGDPGERARLRENAFAWAAGWQVSDYFAALDDLLQDRPVLLPPAAPQAEPPTLEGVAR